MPNGADKILDGLRQVQGERLRRHNEIGLEAKVDAIKLFQQRRFSLTYADLLASERYGPAARFFLAELYGPTDFSLRDAQFARVVPALVKLFPRSIVDTVSALVELHALSESMDTAMGEQLRSATTSAKVYADAWRNCGTRADRERQVELTLVVGESLDRLVRKPLLLKSLRLMRGPAQKAGLGEIQTLLERGFDAFTAMHGADDFLKLVASRERALAERLYSAECAIAELGP